MKFDYSNKKSRPIIRIKKRQKKTSSKRKKITDDFRPPQPFAYPPHQKGLLIEEYFHKHYKDECSCEYLPIYWTNIYMGMHKKQFNKPQAFLQNLLNSIDKKKKYFTVVQSDLGIIENIPDNVLVFGAGGAGHIPIPLLCDTHKKKTKERDIFASFVGVITSKANDAAGIRTKMHQLLSSSDFYYKESNKDIKMFEDMMNKSIFALCPRGYGKTSFRMYEAIQMGCIPVYIYNDPWLPYQDKLDWEDFSVQCHADDIGYLSDILHGYSKEKIQVMQSRLSNVYSKYFSFKSTSKHIIRMVNFIDKHNIEINDNVYVEMTKKSNRIQNEGKKITFAIPAYNEFSDIHPGKSIMECLQCPLQDGRIDEIIISDDCSDNFDKLQDLVKNLPKVKLYRNQKNLGTFGNKKKAVSLSSNDWVILFDSDNSCDKTYIDNIYDERWCDDVIYNPVYAMPQFDYRNQSGKIWTTENAPMLINQNGMSLLNMGNFFLNKNTYLDTLSPYPYDRFDLSIPNYFHLPLDIRQSLYWRLVFDPYDVMFVVKEWLFAGNKLKILKNQKYNHLVSNDSTCKNSPSGQSLVFPIYQNELSCRKKFVDTIDIMDYLHYNCWDKNHPDYNLGPWDFFKIIYKRLQDDNTIDITQIGCFSLFVPKIINRLMTEKSKFNYHIYHPAQQIDAGVFGYADECCPNIYNHNGFDNIHSDILIIEDKFDSQLWYKKILSFCECYENSIIYMCNNKKRATNLCDNITSLNKNIDTLLVKDSNAEHLMAILSPKGL